MWTWLHDVLKTPYTLALEEENARLREENRAMLNALMQAGGHRPVDFTAANALPRRVPNLSYFQRQRKTELESERKLLARFKEVMDGKPPDSAA